MCIECGEHFLCLCGTASPNDQTVVDVAAVIGNRTRKASKNEACQNEDEEVCNLPSACYAGSESECLLVNLTIEFTKVVM
eukprot:SAG11_NODE_4185_length_2023_cov_3.201663_1_plen_80_part_00